MTRLVGSLFNAALALVCAREAMLTADVHRHDPARKRRRIRPGCGQRTCGRARSRS